MSDDVHTRNFPVSGAALVLSKCFPHDYYKLRSQSFIRITYINICVFLHRFKPVDGPRGPKHVAE